MGNRSMFVGMDVHKETIDISVAESGRQACERRHERCDLAFAHVARMPLAMEHDEPSNPMHVRLHRAVAQGAFQLQVDAEVGEGLGPFHPERKFPCAPGERVIRVRGFMHGALFTVPPPSHSFTLSLFSLFFP